MDLTKSELRSLLESRSAYNVSIYMPTHAFGPDMREDKVRFKNLLADAERRLTALGLANGNARRLLQPAAHLLDDVTFWRHQQDGLAVFISPDEFRHYRVQLPLEPCVIVASRYHVKPLLPILSGDGRFYVLAISLNEVRLLRCTRDDAQLIDLGDAPTSLAEALRFDEKEKSLQWHTETQIVRAGGGERPAVFHGQGAGADDAGKKKDILEFFRQLDRAIADRLANQKAPLVLAAVDYLCAIYRDSTSYSHALPEFLPGNPEMLSPDQLHQRAWKLIEPLFKQSQAQAASRYNLAAARAHASSRLEEVVSAAAIGRVDTLFVDVAAPHWGTFDPQQSTIDLHPMQQDGDEDLTDLAAVHTLLHDGTVFAVDSNEMPNGGSVAAVFRY